jgi:hypothetical protein
MKKIITLLFFFWAAHHDSSEYNVQYKRNRKSSDTELLPGASILIHQDLGILHYQMEKVGLVC